MLRTLEAFGFEWDGEVLYQSTRREAYRAALAAAQRRRAHVRLQLFAQDLAGPASTDDDAAGYPGTCRNGPTRAAAPTALRFRVSDAHDPLRRPVLGAARISTWPPAATSSSSAAMASTSYQLAVVVDDAFQEVTRVVRGADLLIEHALADRSAARPWPCHVLSTGTCRWCSSRTAPNYPSRADAVPLDPSRRHPARLYIRPLRFCRKPARPIWPHSSIKDVWNWAIAHWNPQALAGKTACPPVRRRRHKADIYQQKIVGCSEKY